MKRTITVCLFLIQITSLIFAADTSAGRNRFFGELNDEASSSSSSTQDYQYFYSTITKRATYQPVELAHRLRDNSLHCNQEIFLYLLDVTNNMTNIEIEELILKLKLICTECNSKQITESIILQVMTTDDQSENETTDSNSLLSPEDLDICKTSVIAKKSSVKTGAINSWIKEYALTTVISATAVGSYYGLRTYLPYIKEIKVSALGTFFKHNQ